jgi:Spy/CpxP family protein refolding chaperone
MGYFAKHTSTALAVAVLLGAGLSAQGPAVAPSRPGSSAPTGSPAPSGSQRGAGGGTTGRRPSRGPEAWWRERSPIGKELGLTKDQSDRIEKIFQDTRPALDTLDATLRKRESMLSDLIKDDSTELMISQQIDKVESTRSALNKTRQLMLYHMRQVLTTPQRATFEVLHARFQQELMQADLERQKDKQGEHGGRTGR